MTRQELHLAALRDNTDALRRLLDQGAAVDTRDAHGTTPAMVAARFGSLGALDLLIERGADVARARSESGGTPLAYALDHGRTDAVRLLLAAGADANETYPLSSDATPLMKAAASGSEHAVALLLGAGADPNRTAPQGYTALHRAADTGTPALLQMLILAGAAIDHLDSDGETPLMWAAFRQRTENALFLLDRGADARVRNGLGETALSFALGHGDAKLAERLRAATS